MKRVPNRRSGETRRTGNRPRFAAPVVLIVDDNEDNRELFTMVLERLGYELHIAVDGAAGVERAAAVHPDVILMDLAMPRMDGFEATRAIRATPAVAGVHIIAVTAFTDAVSSQRALAAGCDEVLAKPIAPEKLSARVDAIIQARRLGAGGSARDAG